MFQKKWEEWSVAKLRKICLVQKLGNLVTIADIE